MKAYFYPPVSKVNGKLVENPYSKNFIESLTPYYTFCNRNTNTYSLFDLLLNCFSHDIYILNWVDNIGYKRFALFQFIVFFTSLVLIKLKKSKIIWVFHNIHPHKGENWITKKINKIMMIFSDGIITHSIEAKKYLESKSLNNILFMHHPIEKKYNAKRTNVIDSKDIDILIWGTIEAYKGVKEFLEYCKDNHEVSATWRIRIIGKCNDSSYENDIKKLLNENIQFENRKIEFDELIYLIPRTQYVFFPYISNSVSSSGVLMDSLSMYATVLGPNKGAFSDLASEGIVNVYNTFDDLENYLSIKKNIDTVKVGDFLSNNSWAKFGQEVYKYISEVKNVTK
ncbi:hypothetical protein [Klebsiella quasipneumoniae]|nr:hypothetical protein [Klebsiella quasipneumoniae]